MSGLGWWTISGDALLDMLRRAHAGADPDLLYAEEYANSEIERPDDKTNATDDERVLVEARENDRIVFRDELKQVKVALRRSSGELEMFWDERRYADLGDGEEVVPVYVIEPRVGG